MEKNKLINVAKRAQEIIQERYTAEQMVKMDMFQAYKDAMEEAINELNKLITCKSCGSKDFITTTTNIIYHKIQPTEYEDEFNIIHDSQDLDTKTYCASCKEDFPYSVNL